MHTLTTDSWDVGFQKLFLAVPDTSDEDGQTEATETVQDVAGGGDDEHAQEVG